MENKNGLKCESDSLTLKIYQENGNENRHVCDIANQKEISSGEKYHTKEGPNSCLQAQLDLASVDKIQLKYGETTKKFCPVSLNISMDNGQILEAILPDACKTPKGCVEPSDTTRQNGISVKKRTKVIGMRFSIKGAKRQWSGHEQVFVFRSLDRDWEL